VTFRDNVFLNCREVGILVNVSSNSVPGHETFSMPIDGQEINVARSVVDGLFIYGNLVLMRDNAPYGAVQVQQDGLSNVRIANNVFRTESGAGKGWSVKTYRDVKHITVCGNTCEPGMRADVPTNAAVFDNYDFAGQPMPGLPNRRPVVPLPPPCARQRACTACHRCHMRVSRMQSTIFRPGNRPIGLFFDTETRSPVCPSTTQRGPTRLDPTAQRNGRT
jgi:hypothetical protein